MAALDQIAMSEKLKNLMKLRMQPFRLMQRAAEKYIKQKRFAYKHHAKGVNRRDRRTAAAMFRRTRNARPELRDKWRELRDAAERAPMLTPAKRVLDKNGAVAYIAR